MNNTFLAKRKIFLSVILVIILGVAVYGNSINGEFIWDDEALVQDNVYIRDWSNFSKIFSDDIAVGIEKESNSYRPLQMFSYMADYSLWKLNARGYHLTNIVLHILAALSLYYLTNLLFGDNRLSFLTAIFYVVHPIHTEVVTYISGRADSLALLFMLLCFIFYIKGPSSKSAGLYFLMIFSYAAALLSRENSVILPVLLLLYHYSFKKKVQVKAFLPIVILSIIYILLRVTVLKALLSHVVYTTTLIERAPGFFVAVSNYIKLLFLPIHLHMEYGGTLFSAGDPKALLGVILFIILTGYAFWKKENNKLFFFCISWFFVAILPVSNLYPINAYMAEHWLYVPSVGFFLILAQALSLFYQRKQTRVPAIFLILALLGFYSYLTIRQNKYWREPVGFYEQTIKLAPDSSRAYNNLGKAYYEAGREEDAVIPCFKKAIDLKPDFHEAYFNLGFVYFHNDRIEDAIISYKRAIELKPDYKKAYKNLGHAYHHSHRYQEAIPFYKKAIELKPDYEEALYKLGNVYASLKKNTEAKATYEKLVQINSNYEEVYNNLANIYYKDGRKKKAIALYEKAIEINPGYGEAYNNLSIIYYRQKQYESAGEYLDKATELGFTNPVLFEKLKPYRQ